MSPQRPARPSHAASKGAFWIKAETPSALYRHFPRPFYLQCLVVHVGIGRGLGEQFAAQIVERGAVDAVSGATLTSNATAEALAACLEQARLA